MKRIAICIFAIVIALSACGPSELEQYQALLKSRKDRYFEMQRKNQSKIHDFIQLLQELRNGFADTPENIEFEFEVDTLNFTAAFGVLSDSAVVNPKFNAIFLSTQSLGDSLLPNMQVDFYANEYFEAINGFNKTGFYEYSYMDSTDSRYWNTGTAWLKAFDQLRYVIIVDPWTYFAGSASALTGTMEIAELKGRMYVYDLKKKTYIGVSEFNSFGPDEISYSYKEPNSDNGYQDKSQQAAESKMRTANIEHIRLSSIGLLGDFVGLPSEFITPEEENANQTP
jgi:hypothetical protein